MTQIALEALLIGPVQPLGPRHTPSGIGKVLANMPLHLGFTGLAGDAQGDTIHHGGVDKALHHYPLDHYPSWSAELGERDVLRRAGAFGENLATFGLTESDVAVGDVFGLGQAIIEVSQGRQPCWKLNHRFETVDMARRVQQSGRTGWYYRVLQPGLVAPGDRLERLHRHAPRWTIRAIWQVFYIEKLDRAALQKLVDLPQLAPTWRHHAYRRLQSGQVEDWTKRLDGEVVR